MRSPIRLDSSQYSVNFFFNVGLKTSRLITNLYMVFIFLIYRSIDELALLGKGMASLIF